MFTYIGVYSLIYYHFWMEKATIFSGLTLQELTMLLPKSMNPPNVPQCRPIEDFFKGLATRVYDGIGLQAMLEPWNVESDLASEHFR